MITINKIVKSRVRFYSEELLKDGGKIIYVRFSSI